MCNKCINHHNGLFDNHYHYNLDKEIKEIFAGYCLEKKHPNKLEYYCKNHNQLCCAACLCKIEEKGDGKHKDCDAYTIEEIKDEKRNKLKENMNCLEKLSINLEKSINELKNLLEKINENKENLKSKIQKIFTKIRNLLNEREEQLLLEVDEQFNKVFFDENIIKESEKLPIKINKFLEKGKLLIKEWNENKLSFLINFIIF